MGVCTETQIVMTETTVTITLQEFDDMRKRIDHQEETINTLKGKMSDQIIVIKTDFPTEDTLYEHRIDDMFFTKSKDEVLQTVLKLFGKFRKDTTDARSKADNIRQDAVRLGEKLNGLINVIMQRTGMPASAQIELKEMSKHVNDFLLGVPEQGLRYAPNYDLRA